MNMGEKALAGKRIGLFGKGGCGKSTVVVLLARVLSEKGYHVCVLDADSTNVGLHSALGVRVTPASLVDYFGGMVFSGGSVTCPVDDPTPLPGAEITMDVLPPQFCGQNEEGIVLLSAGKIGDRGPGAGCDGPISKIARDLRIEGNGEEFVTLVDFKAGFEDSARGAVTSLDWALVIVDPTTAAIQMAANMKQMVHEIRAGVLPATRHLATLELVQWANRIFREATIRDVAVVLNRVRDEEMEQYMRAMLADKGIEPVGVIGEDPSIATSWLKGLPLEAGSAREDVEKIAAILESIAQTDSVPAH